MRDYGKVSPLFWTGATGKELRKHPEALVVAMYLMTSPHANMLGLYYMPTLYIAHETGLGMEGAMKGLQWAEQAGFCSYDHDSEMVWVHEMAKFQIADSLKDTDKRCLGVQNEYNSLGSNPYLESFYDKYCNSFHMSQKRQNSSKKASPLEAPSKPLASQEQEQEQEQDSISDVVENSASPKRKPKTQKTTVPENFEISEQVRIWATSKNFGDLEQHLEYFVSKAAANGYKYADWDAAFKTAIRDDWAKLRTPRYPNQGYQSAAQQTANEQAKWDNFLNGDSRFVDVTPKKSLMIEEVGHA
ncbi:hypothetical protein [Acinetobacter nosocomialis]|uniref:hypothetical protein n=1 Tax=Acinetobacter nosocomialis TaxID=106654 RepID=UPI0023B17153|nr:hypothetical protein [Acinetobacter nosocomialis]MDE9415763.1 hypothetical protein [Acinetobacter nosocomialis]